MTLAEFKTLLAQCGIVSDEYARIQITNLNIGEPGGPSSMSLTPEGLGLGTEARIYAENNTFPTITLYGGDGILQCRGVDTLTLQPPPSPPPPPPEE